MSTEDRLRDAIRSEADAVEPAPDAWGRLQRRFRASVPRNARRRWPIAVAVVGAVAIAGVAAAVIVRDDETGPRVETPATTPGESAMPSEIVAVTEDGRLVVLTSEDGSELRTLAYGVAVHGGAYGVAADGGVAVTTDGGHVYFSVQSSSGSPCQRPMLRRVAIDGGAFEEIAPGRLPAVAPNGAGIAFTRPPDCTHADAQLVVRAIDGSWESVTSAGVATDVDAVSWSPNSRHLTYRLLGLSSKFPRAIRVNGPPDRLEDGTVIQIPDGTMVTSYRGDSDELIGVAAASGVDPDQRMRVVVFDADTGERIHDLFRLVESCCPGWSVSDPSGRHVLGIGRGGVLLRWSEGDGEPTLINENGIVAAAWVPVPAPRPPTRTMTTTPPFPCGTEVPFVPTVLPEGFSSEPVPGSSPPGSVRTGISAVLHYGDGSGRFIEIHHPGTLFLEILGRDEDFPNVTVLGEPGTLAPIAPTRPDPLVVLFPWPSDVSDPCSRWSLDGYGVTEPELRSFAEGLIPR